MPLIYKPFAGYLRLIRYQCFFVLFQGESQTIKDSNDWRQVSGMENGNG